MPRIVLYASWVLLTAAGRGVAEEGGGDALFDLRPIITAPEPVGELRSELQWIRTERIRGLWMNGNLDDPCGNTGQTQGEVLAAMGFNLVCLGMDPDRDNRSRSRRMDDDLVRNVQAARQLGLHLLIVWKYGSNHQEPYRRYRQPFQDGAEAGKSCCPLDEDYLERHVGRWAVRAAEGGADGFILDTEMYESDGAEYPGPCVCDQCFRDYLDEFARNGAPIYESVPPSRRGNWLQEQNVWGHYCEFFQKRTTDYYDRLRSRCQAINPAFLFGYAPTVLHVRGLAGGLGTPTVPCIVFSEHEYPQGPGPWTIANQRYIRAQQLPALYVCGLYVAKLPPREMAQHALLSALYTDGWWAWYGTALLTDLGEKEGDSAKEPYGRHNGVAAREYWDRLTRMHQRLDESLAGPKDRWPAFPESSPDSGINRSGTRKSRSSSPGYWRPGSEHDARGEQSDVYGSLGGGVSR